MKSRVWLALAVIAGCAVPSLASAQSSGVKMYSPSTGERVRVGTSCTLKIDGRPVYGGLCNISYDQVTMMTTIDTGRATYSIQRNEEEPGEASFYRGSRPIDGVYAQGACWVGERVSFCAR